MGTLSTLLPLLILSTVVAALAWIGYQILLYSNELAARGVRKMEKKNVVFTKDGATVAVKEVREEDVADRTQRAFVKTWNASGTGTGIGAKEEKRGVLGRTKTR